MDFKNLIEKLDSVNLKINLEPKWEESYSKENISCKVLGNHYRITPKVKDGAIYVELMINYLVQELYNSTIEEAKLVVENDIKSSALNLFNL